MMESLPLFHVAARAIPTGEVLHPYAVARDYPALVRLAERELGSGPVAVRRLLAGEEWGRLLRQGGYQAEMVLLEAAFERTRVHIASLLPSRLDAVYAWRSLDLAERFRARYRPHGIIHRCALVAGTTLECDGALVVEAFEAVDLVHPSDQDFRQVEERAARYWRAQEPPAFPELLVHGTVVVEAIVPPSAASRAAASARPPAGRAVASRRPW